jgi:predicted nucleic acid-binding protein
MDDLELAPIVLDASCLLNLYASGKLGEIAETLTEPLVVSDYVLHQEALFVRHKESDVDEEERKPVDLNPLVSAGLIKVISIDNEEEQNIFIDLATELDDGEAITIALAECRRCKVATDDRKALRVISVRSLVHSVSTLDLVKRWADTRKVSKDEIKAVLVRIWTDASYYPGEQHPLYNWWRDMTSEIKETNNEETAAH